MTEGWPMTGGVDGLLAMVAILAGIAIVARMFGAMHRKAASEVASLAERVEPQGPSLAP